MAILIIDDSFFARKIIINNLIKLGYKSNFLEASEGSEGFELALRNSHKLEMIFLDINMPGINGLLILRQIREEKSLADVPIVMITSEAHRHVVVACLLAGANDYLVKPFNVHQLKNKLVVMLGLALLKK